MEDYQNKSCTNCGTALVGEICHQCGQSRISHRWSTPILLQQFLHQLTNIEKGFWYTAKILFIFPGKLITDYWKGKTISYYNPFRYMLIWTAINLLIGLWLGIDDMLQESLQPENLEASFGEERIATADQKFDSWMNFLVLLLIPVLSGLTFLFFKKREKNYAEHLIMNTYILGQQGLISSFTQFIFYFFPAIFSGYFIINFAIGWIYNSMVFIQVFKEPWWMVVLKAFVIGAIGVAALFVFIFAFSAIAIFFS